ncbi:MAG: acyl-CoA dehydrogenase [Omnitrophica WOR_2 bacterium GWF2_38_59]|nr:MAG: acyl-CoA dehydrogenase [Omnitrophica WOR_2 bacterium GWF2_38_59]OGX46860.1 MAG: acyl-CoA dehydrogenase [Omnitrophica WOR_2 bacterium RIFOXYA2_FULL_38_17]OGX51639.1 MAG: acyl-CoA dehydrogenase [Omnitrophica WOR_2 bacterium RIFOXYA12_FULL_38_10]OGX58807.1 MAG: acyl-CoA dehydrogenase [Omnitrophica WOR_2 bacterium RIFOXYC2_FULL_38_12]OGX59689.1 MAG: acyl-CoA dehydrogenase [Omnitrophica WOR_2 bacterium RIFOXYB2_FULL_38_16]HBG61523.1 acyl-CoA dehydrogenase [Candidatus Omnitrophota bacterium]
MNYLLTEEQEMIRDLCRQITDEKIRPVAAELDKTEEFPWEIMKVMAKSDLFGLYIDEKYGGMGGGILELSIATEEFSKGCGGIAICYAASALGTLPILILGSEEQKQKYIPDLAAGKHLAAFGITEPAAGSDASAMQTTAVKKGDKYILNGTKHFITNGGEAEIYTVVAMTDKSKGSRGASIFIVEKGTPGFTFGKKEDKLGIRASATNELNFVDCEIPAENLLGKEGQGFIGAMRVFDKSRPGIGAQAVGIAQGALDHAIRYARERKQFGKSISSFQGIQFMLADMATQVEAARALVYASAREVDSGVTKNYGMHSAMSKLYASDVAMKVTTDAVQIFGGYGYMKEYPVEKYMRDAKITQIYEGTNQIQRSIIALGLIKEAAGS